MKTPVRSDAPGRSLSLPGALARAVCRRPRKTAAPAGRIPEPADRQGLLPSRPLQGRIDLVDGDTEIVPGLRLVEAHGPTPGHMAVLAASGAKHLVYADDAVIHKIHMRRARKGAEDPLPQAGTATRQAM